MFFPLKWTFLMGRRPVNVSVMTANENGGTATITPQIPVRLDFDAQVPGFARAVSHLDRAATKELDAAGIDPLLRELVRVRASQLNGCAYCVDMHTKDARAAGETEQRLYALPAWRETPFYTNRERAALALTEDVTLMARDHVPEAAYQAAAEVLTPAEIGALLSLIITINAWNAIGVTTRAWTPGSYEP
jgi:AhpD family alkylhydroperoxidase